MNININLEQVRVLREMLKKNSRYGSLTSIVNESIMVFYEQEKRRKFR